MKRWTSTLNVFGILLWEAPRVDLLSPCTLYSPARKNPSVSNKLYIEEHHTATPATHLNWSIPALEPFSLSGWSSGKFTACVQCNDPAALLSVPSLQNSCQPKYSGYTSESEWRLWNHTQGKNRTEGKKARAFWSTSQESHLAWGIFILISFWPSYTNLQLNPSNSFPFICFNTLSSYWRTVGSSNQLYMLDISIYIVVYLVHPWQKLLLFKVQTIQY